MSFPGGEPHTVARMADEHGFGHVSVQWDYAPQRPLALRLRDELHSRGLTFGVWEAEPMPGTGEQAVLESGADHYIAQAETPRPWWAIVESFRRAYPDLPAAVVTTFGGIGAVEGNGYDKTVAKPVIDAGFGCLTEAYVNANPQATPDNLDWVAETQLGWPYSQSTIGVWGGFPASVYITQHRLAAYRDYWVWLAETMTPADWSALGALNLR